MNIARMAHDFATDMIDEKKKATAAILDGPAFQLVPGLVLLIRDCLRAGYLAGYEKAALDTTVQVEQDDKALSTLRMREATSSRPHAGVTVFNLDISDGVFIKIFTNPPTRGAYAEVNQYKNGTWDTLVARMITEDEAFALREFAKKLCL